jgi:hypothetical protein
MTLDIMALEIMTLDIMALFPVVDCTMAVPDVGCGKDIPLTRDVNPDRRVPLMRRSAHARAARRRHRAALPTLPK